MRMLLMCVAALAMVIAPAYTYAQAHDWTAVRALPRDTNLIVKELGGRGGHVRGRLLLATNSEITVLKGGRPIIIQRSTIGRIDEVRSDSVWAGAIIGVAYALVMRATYAGEACLGRSEPSCTLKSATIAGGLGALIDYSIKDERVAYKAPKPSVTFLRLAF